MTAKKEILSGFFFRKVSCLGKIDCGEQSLHPECFPRYSWVWNILADTRQKHCFAKQTPIDRFTPSMFPAVSQHWKYTWKKPNLIHGGNVGNCSYFVVNGMPIQGSKNLCVLWDMLLVGDASSVSFRKVICFTKNDCSEDRISTQGVFLGGNWEWNILTFIGWECWSCQQAWIGQVDAQCISPCSVPELKLHVWDKLMRPIKEVLITGSSLLLVRGITWAASGKCALRQEIQAQWFLLWEVLCLCQELTRGRENQNPGVFWGRFESETFQLWHGENTPFLKRAQWECSNTACVPAVFQHNNTQLRGTGLSLEGSVESWYRAIWPVAYLYDLPLEPKCSLRWAHSKMKNSISLEKPFCCNAMNYRDERIRT